MLNWLDAGWIKIWWYYVIGRTSENNGLKKY